jgi:transposase
MAKPTSIIVKESILTLKKLLKKQPNHLQKRVQMLILIKEGKHSSKHDLATALCVNHNSIQTWRTKYTKEGLNGLLSYHRTSHKQPVITPAVHKAIEQKLNNAAEAFISFEALRAWIAETYIPYINYHTVNKYIKRHFGAKLKVARKQHINKDVKVVEAFKKNAASTRRIY